MCGVGVGVPAPFYVCSGLLFQCPGGSCTLGEGGDVSPTYPALPPPDAGESPKLTLQLKALPQPRQLHVAVVGLLVYMVPGAKGAGAGLSGGRSSYRINNRQHRGIKAGDIT